LRARLTAPFAFFTFLGCAGLACSPARPRLRPRPLPPCSEVEPLALVVDGGPNLNPGPDGQPLPTVVRVYQLRSDARLAASSIEEMARNDRGVLADDVLEIQELTLFPSGRELPALRRNPQSTHVAVTALFRRPRGASWRAVVPVPAPDPLHCYREQPRWLQFFLQDYDVFPVTFPEASQP
jgi:type VI secretion system protein VasD